MATAWNNAKPAHGAAAPSRHLSEVERFGADELRKLLDE
jgi:hypothetical protein